MKDREEYLLKYEERLLASLSAVYQSVNRTLALMYTFTGITLLVEWGRVTKLSMFGAEFPLQGIEMVIALPIILTVLTTFLDYSLVTASRLLGELKINAERLLFLNADAKPVSLTNLDLFGTGTIGFVLSFARAELIKLLRIKAVAPPNTRKPTSFWDLIRVGLALLLRNRRLIDWAASVAVRLVFVLAILILPLIGSASAMQRLFLISSTDPIPWRLVCWAPLALLGLVGASLTFSTFLLLVSYSADFLETLKKEWLEAAMAANTLLPLYQELINITARVLVQAVYRGI